MAIETITIKDASNVTQTVTVDTTAAVDSNEPESLVGERPSHEHAEY